MSFIVPYKHRSQFHLAPYKLPQLKPPQNESSSGYDLMSSKSSPTSRCTSFPVIYCRFSINSQWSLKNVCFCGWGLNNIWGSWPKFGKFSPRPVSQRSSLNYGPRNCSCLLSSYAYARIIWLVCVRSLGQNEIRTANKTSLFLFDWRFMEILSLGSTTANTLHYCLR